MNFNYFYKTQADEFSFIRIPKALMTEEVFSDLSIDAKILYGLLMDRMSLSVKNEWLDEQNRAYILYPIADIMEEFRVSKRKATLALPMWCVMCNPVVFQIIGLLLRATKCKLFIDAPSICAASLGLTMYGVLALILI